MNLKDRVVVYLSQIDGTRGKQIIKDLPGSLLDFEKSDRFANSSNISVNLLAKNTGNSAILITGKINCTVECECDKCLEKFVLPMKINNFSEYFDEFDDYIDLTDSIRETILLGLPNWAVCSDNCKGLCSVCGLNANTYDCKCAHVEEEFVEETVEMKNPWDCLDNIKIPKDKK